jgi:hypothetical protein
MIATAQRAPERVVLVVDDEENMRPILARMLAEE